MALSVVNFRMHHGNVFEQISFNGNGIKLLELKREVVERKKINKSLDFDLNVVDDNGKAYSNDDDIVPKNASVIVKRVPANAKTSLLTRLNNRGQFAPHHSATINTPSKSEIMMPMKEDDEEPEEDAPVPTTPSGEELPFPMEEENVVLKRTIPLGLHGDVAPVTAAGGPMKGLSGIPKPPPGAMYACTRCNKTGHNAKYCPTIGDPNFDPNIQLQNIPRASRKKVITLEGIDTTNKTVVQNTDGTFEIFESSSAGLDKLGEATVTANIDMAEVPEHLKCALSHVFLREAVALPCCKKCVNDTIIRQELVNSGLKCPLCGSAGISPDWLVVRGDIRDAVEDYIKNYGKPAIAPGAAAPLPTAPVYGLNPLLARPPPPPGAPPADPYGVAPAFSGYHYNSVPTPVVAGGGPLPPVPAGAPPLPHQQPPMMLPPEIPPLEALPYPLPIDEFYRELEFQRQEKVYLEKEFNKRYGFSNREGDRYRRGSDRHGDSSHSSGSTSERDGRGYYVSRHYRDSRSSGVEKRDESSRADDDKHDKRSTDVSGSNGASKKPSSSSSSSSTRDDKYKSSSSREDGRDRSDRDRTDRRHRDEDSTSRSRREEDHSESRDKRDSSSRKASSTSTSRRDRSASGDRREREDRKRSSSTRDAAAADEDRDRRKSSRRDASRSPERRSSSHREEDSSRRRTSDDASSSDRHKRSDRDDRESESRRGSDRDRDRSARDREEEKPATSRSDRDRERDREKDRDREREKDKDRERDRNGRDSRSHKDDSTSGGGSRRSEKRDGSTREDRHDKDEESKKRRVVESTESSSSGRDASTAGREKERERDRDRGGREERRSDREERSSDKKRSSGREGDGASGSSSTKEEKLKQGLSAGRAVVKSPVTTPEQTHRKGKKEAQVIRYL